MDSTHGLDPLVRTAAGQIRGSTAAGVGSFLGVPYAAPPVGPALYGAPTPAPAWEGVRDALTVSATPPQRPYPAPFDRLLLNPVIPGGDFLTVNVWTPAPDPQAKLPVMVWIPGGAYVRGSNAIPVYDGTNFARDGVVLVTMNYRLGAPGFAVLPDAPANRGLRDQIAALEWVRDNISAFGGDPDNVTVFGESAGGISVLTLLASPATRGLFRRAICQSGTGRVAGTATDLAIPTAYFANQLGVPATAQALAEIGIDRMLEAQFETVNAMRQQPDPRVWGLTTVLNGGGLMPFFPVLDDEIVPVLPEAGLAGGTGRDVDLLIGTTTDEFRFFTVAPGLAALVTEEMLAASAAALGWPASLLGRYRANRPGAGPGDIQAALVTDSYFRIPSLRAADAHSAGGRTFVYEFAWGSEHLDLRAAHALEIGFVFDNLGVEGGDWMTGGRPGPQALADEMHGAWAAFARAGDPGWAGYDVETRLVRVFDDPESAVVSDPRGDERQAWEGVI